MHNYVLNNYAFYYNKVFYALYLIILLVYYYMGFLSRLFTFQGTVYGLRKRYDRMRERADREDDTGRRMQALKILDQAEPTLVLLEEQRISRYDRGRLVATVESGIEQAKAVLDNMIRPREQDARQQAAGQRAIDARIPA